MGVLKENPIHQEMNEAMHLAGCDFALSVVQNSQHKIVGAWAGKPELVMDAGVKLVDAMYKKEISSQPDIVITPANGHPHDINLYQSMNALHTACQIVKPKGIIVLIAECSEGHGSQLYIDWFRWYKTSLQIQKALDDNFIIGAHKAYYHRVAVENHPVIFVTKMETSEVEGRFSFKKEATPNSALSQAFSIAGDKSQVLVVPQGTTTFLTLKNNIIPHSFFLLFFCLFSSFYHSAPHEKSMLFNEKSISFGKYSIETPTILFSPRESKLGYL